MPSIPLHLSTSSRQTSSSDAIINPLPQLLQTPSGLAILEIQGTINMPSPESSISDSTTPIGRLVFPPQEPKDPSGNTSNPQSVYLYVGRHQRLTGEVKRLVNPLAVIRRRDTDENAQSAPGVEELEIAEIIRWKIVFSSRPEPVGEDSL